MEVSYKTERPIFGIDTKYYRTNLTSKYLRKFRNEQTNTSVPNGHFLMFKNGSFYKTFSDIEDIDQEPGS